MPIPFRDLNEDENTGVVGYLRFVDEPDGKGMRGALFVISTRGEPLDFSFTRIDVHGGFLWRAGESRRQAVTALTKSLFQSAGRTPAVIISLADEVPPRVFTEDIEVQVPICRVVTTEMTPQAASEEHESVSDSLDLFWATGRPPPDSSAGKIIESLSDRQLLLEPFERALIGLEEAFSS